MCIPRRHRACLAALSVLCAPLAVLREAARFRRAVEGRTIEPFP
ncbi:MAG TPA: hypothetical protein VF881_19185 [Polyangiaceae bacterium]